VIIFDEPSAALTEKEIEDLFAIIRDLRNQDLGIIYISHRMDEIKVITDRVTVMRDGAYVGTLITDDCTKEDIINMMVGRVIYEEPKTHSMVEPDAPVVLKVEHLNAGRMVQNVSFELKKGEILGFSGLMGAGRTEVARAIYGADSYDSGEIFIKGELVRIKQPYDAVKRGVCYLSEDRKRYGLLLSKTVAENSVLASLEDYVTAGWINDNAISLAADKVNKMLKTKTPSVFQETRNLSGGNQQKVVVARWLLRNCDIFIFDEPTRGIDIGAKSEMYALMEQLASQGKSIIMISSELSEIQRLSDRVIVMCEGRISADLDIALASSEQIMKYATMSK
jgi:ribose transport system ATP-binding protein